MKIYESPEVQSVAYSSGGDGTACGMQQVSPFVLGSGEVETERVLFKATPKPVQQTSRERLDVKYDSKLVS